MSENLPNNPEWEPNPDSDHDLNGRYPNFASEQSGTVPDANISERDILLGNLSQFIITYESDKVVDIAHKQGILRPQELARAMHHKSLSSHDVVASDAWGYGLLRYRDSLPKDHVDYSEVSQTYYDFMTKFDRGHGNYLLELDEALKDEAWDYDSFHDLDLTDGEKDYLDTKAESIVVYDMINNLESEEDIATLREYADSIDDLKLHTHLHKLIDYELYNAAEYIISDIPESADFALQLIEKCNVSPEQLTRLRRNLDKFIMSHLDAFASDDPITTKEGIYPRNYIREYASSPARANAMIRKLIFDRSIR